MKTTLINSTNQPLEHLWLLWQASRTDTPLDELTQASTEEMETLFTQLVESELPVCEHVHFTFLLEDIPVTLREQMVRHRVGHRFGDNYGVDVIPDLTASTWWSQTMRTRNMKNFAQERKFFIPESILENKNALTQYVSLMNQIEDTYTKLIDMGIPMEDVRQVLPQSVTSRLSWTLNLSSLIKICRTRSCWIAQLGLWEPIIKGMVSELTLKVHPAFRCLASPPCMRGTQFVGCKFSIENEKRLDRTDDLPACPLYVDGHTAYRSHKDVEKWLPAHLNVSYWAAVEDFRIFWGFDPLTTVAGEHK